MKLSEAIEKSTLAEVKSMFFGYEKGALTEDNLIMDCACPLGAAFVTLTGCKSVKDVQDLIQQYFNLPVERYGTTWNFTSHIPAYLDDHIDWTPTKVWEEDLRASKLEHPMGGQIASTQTLMSVIMDLTDCNDWSRQQIVDWLKEGGL